MGGVYALVKNLILNKGEKLRIDIAAIEPFENPDNIGLLFVRLSNKTIFRIQIYKGIILHLTYRKIMIDLFYFHHKYYLLV